MKEHGPLYYWLYNKVFWYLKQLLPLFYVSKTEDETGPVLVIWRMWFGVVFNERRYRLAQ